MFYVGGGDDDDSDGDGDTKTCRIVFAVQLLDFYRDTHIH